MKILILDIYYEPFLTAFYGKYPNAQSLSYLDQKSLLLDQAFGTGDFYSKNFIKLGHKAEDIIINNRNLQEKWAKENGIMLWKNFSDKIPGLRIYFHSDWKDKVLEAQIRDYKPDVIYCQGITMPGPIFLKKLKRKGQLIVGQIASKANFDPEFLSVYDLILTSFPHYVKRFQQAGVNSEYFKIGFESSLINRLKSTKRKYGAVFIGGFTRHHLAENPFQENLEWLAKKAPVDFWGYGIKNISDESPIKKRYHSEIWGMDMYNILYNSKISLNRHVPYAENYANNMRLFESTGVGTMLLTDYKTNLHQLFKIGTEVETYKTKEELVDKVKYYLSHEKERQKIAKAGQRRTLKDHTYESRMKELVKILNKYL